MLNGCFFLLCDVSVGGASSYRSGESYSSSSGVSSAGSRAMKREPNAVADSELAIKETLLIEDFKEDESPAYIKIKDESKEEYRAETAAAAAAAAAAKQHGSAVPASSSAAAATGAADEDVVDEATLKDRTVLNELFEANEALAEKLLLLQIPENLQLQELDDEGHIGKLRIRKSGRVELCIDNEKNFNVSLSVSGPFLQVS